MCCRCWVSSRCVAFIWLHRHENRKWLQTCLLIMSCQCQLEMSLPGHVHAPILTLINIALCWQWQAVASLCCVTVQNAFLFSGIRMNLSSEIDRMVPFFLFISFPKVIASLHLVCYPVFFVCLESLSISVSVALPPWETSVSWEELDKTQRCVQTKQWIIIWFPD